MRIGAGAAAVEAGKAVTMVLGVKGGARGDTRAGCTNLSAKLAA